MNVRHLSPFDRLLAGLQRALETVAGEPLAQRRSPGRAIPGAELKNSERQHAAGLMRINHTGEVCAQALYDGQTALARDTATRRHLRKAADEETDHLVWCAERIAELGSRPSWLNPMWYAGSYAIGVLAALAGDNVSLGFVIETERQVEAHLEEHMDTLPPQDERSRAILKQMQADEAHHADQARARGGMDPLPFPIPRLMHLTSMVMKRVAYRI